VLEREGEMLVKVLIEKGYLEKDLVIVGHWSNKVFRGCLIFFFPSRHRYVCF